MTLTRRLVTLPLVLAVSTSLLAAAPAAVTAETAPDDANYHQPAIDALARLNDVDVFAGTGCADPGDDGDSLCADEPLPRWEMAVWLARVTQRSNPPATTTRYSDVDSGQWWAPHAERLALLGIDRGCGTRPLRFCANDAVDRAEAAGLLARAFGLPAAEAAGFDDVSSDHPAAADIDRLAAAGVTAGCDTGPSRYCPHQQVTRGEMATFLARAAGLTAPAPPVEPAYVPAVDDTLLPVDPAVTIGTLDNGLTYYLRHNDDPGGSLDVRLLVDVGSVDENDREAGIGHFVEHMLFNGTEDYPGNSILEALREIGVELGPDAGAHVGHDETVYQAQVRTDDPANVARVFHALSQMAGSATFEAEAVESERGVVLDEMRLALAGVGGVIGREFDRIYTRGTPYAGRDPIGRIRIVNTLTPKKLRAFYEKWYVPSNLAVVAVGDMDVEDLEALVEDHFGPLPAGDEHRPPKAVVVPDPESSSHVVTDPRQAFSYISLDIPIAVHDLATVGGDRLSTMETLIEAMIQNRLNDAYQRGELSQVDPPSFITFSYNRGLRYYGTNWRGDKLDTASTDYLAVLLTAQEHGFTAGDLQRAASQLQTSLDFWLNSAATTQDAQWAGLYQNHFFYRADISAVPDAVARTAALLAQMTPEELTDHYRWQMHRGGLLAIAVGPDPSSVPTVADLDAAWAAAAPGPPPPEKVAVTELMAAPEPVEPISQGAIDLLPDAYQWEFANGARVIFAPSDIAAGIVQMRAQSLGGWSVLEPGDWALSGIARDAVTGSGVGDLSRSELSRFLEDRAVGVEPYIGESTEGFSAGGSPDDAETMFALTHLLMTAPRVDERAYDDAINTARERLALVNSDPRWQAAAAYWEARHGDVWYRIAASAEEIASLTPQRLLSLYQSRLGSVDDTVVAIVGDIDASVVEDLARRYIGTLPAGEPDSYVNRRRPMPSDVVRREVKLTEAESTVLVIYQEAALEATPLRSVATDVLSSALSERIFLAIREDLGASYSAGAQIDVGTLPEHVIDSAVFATLDPARYDEVHAKLLEILADVAANGLTDAEYAQAVAVRASDYAVSNNGHLLATLLSARLVGDENVLTQARRAEELARLTPEDVQELAAALYGEGGRIEIIRRP